MYEYKLILQPKTWHEAQKYCWEEFARLAVISDIHNLNASVQQRDFPVWIGLHREGKYHSHIRRSFCSNQIVEN